MISESKCYLVRVVHGHGDARALEIVYFQNLLLASVCRGILQLQFAWTWCDEIHGPILPTVRHGIRSKMVRDNPSARLHPQYLITECMTPDDDGFRPSRNGLWDLL